MPRLNTSPPLRRLAMCAHLLLLMTAGCASSPPPRLHSLLASQPRDAAAAPGAAPVFIELDTVGVPASVDQPQWVVRTQDGTLRMLEQERWVGPLRDELRGALAEGLARRWRAVDARSTPPPAGGAWRVRVDVARFETVAGSGAWLGAAWQVSATDSSAVSLACRTTVRALLDGQQASDPPALAAAHRRAVERLTDQIGAQLKALSEGRAAQCPPDETV